MLDFATALGALCLRVRNGKRQSVALTLAVQSRISLAPISVPKLTSDENTMGAVFNVWA